MSFENVAKLTQNTAFLSAFQKIADGNITQNEVGKLANLAKRHGISLEKLVEASREQFDSSGLQAAQHLIQAEIKTPSKSASESLKETKSPKSGAKALLEGFAELVEQVSASLKSLAMGFPKTKEALDANTTSPPKGTSTDPLAPRPNTQTTPLIDTQKLQEMFQQLVDGLKKGDPASQSQLSGTSDMLKSFMTQLQEIQNTVLGQQTPKEQPIKNQNPLPYEKKAAPPTQEKDPNRASLPPLSSDSPERSPTTSTLPKDVPQTKTPDNTPKTSTPAPKTSTPSTTPTGEPAPMTREGLLQEAGPLVANTHKELQQAKEAFIKNPDDPNAKLKFEEAMHKLEELVNLLSSMMKKFHEMSMAIIRNI